MKTNRLKGTLSALLAVIMVFTLIPCFTSANAAEETNVTAKIMLAGYDKESCEFYKIAEPLEASVIKDTVTVTDIMDAAVNNGSLTYSFGTDGQSGQIITINDVTAQSPDGWLFTINGIMAPVGASSAVVSDGDEILWYVGTPENGYNSPDWDSIESEDKKDETQNTVKDKLKIEAEKYETNAVIPPTVQENSDITSLVVRLRANALADSEITLSYKSENDVIKANSMGYTLASKIESDMEETVTLLLNMDGIEYEKPITVTLYAADKNIDKDNLLENIAKEYSENTSDYWKVSAVSAYNKLYGGVKMSDKAKADFVSGAVKAISETDGDTALAMNIIALRSLGYNPSDITLEDGSKINAAEKLASSPSTGNNGDTYRLLAYSVCGYDNQSDTDAAIERLLSSQIDGKGWSNGYDDGIDSDTTGAVLLGLSPYYGTNTDVKTAIDNSVDYLSSLMQIDGNIKNNYGANANTSAICAIGLEALGIDVKSDERFKNNSVSLFDGIMSFASEDETGFVYEYPETAVNDFATKQAFIAVMAADKNVNVFDFSDMPKKAINLKQSSDNSTGGHKGGGGGSSANTVKKTVDVYLTLTGDTAHGKGNHTEFTEWISEIKVEVTENASAREVIEKALSDGGYTVKGFENGYISEITTPDGLTLGEYTNGEQSGWMYSVNGESPAVGINDYIVKNGDKINVYYTDSWSDEPSDKPQDKPTDTPSDNSFPDVKSDDWFFDAAQFAAQNNLIEGNEKGEFMPDAALTRAMAVAILCRYTGNSQSEYNDGGFSDVSKSDWFAQSVNWAAEKGIVSGMGNGLFAPNDSITREQLALILYNLINPDETEAYEIKGFSDTDNISDWAKDAIGWAVKTQLISGMENGTLAPQSTATRAQFAMILMRLNDLTK